MAKEKSIVLNMSKSQTLNYQNDGVTFNITIDPNNPKDTQKLLEIFDRAKSDLENILKENQDNK